jgi:hypothetical protein
MGPSRENALRMTMLLWLPLYPCSSAFICGKKIQALIAIPYTLFDASSMASASVG